MSEARQRVQLTAAPTIEIGDINDITGVIYDKERHITSGKVDVTVTGDNVGLAKESTLTGIHGILDTRIIKADTDNVIISTGTVDTKIIGDNVGLAKETTLLGIKTQTDKLQFDGNNYLRVALSSDELGLVKTADIPKSANGNIQVSINEDVVNLAKETTLSSINSKISICDTNNVIISTGFTGITVTGDNVGLAKESTLSSIDSKITKCNTDSVVISTGFTGVRLTATDIMLPVDMQARYYASSKEIDQLVNPGSIVTGANIIYTANFNSVTVMGRCEFDGILHVDCSPLGYNFFKDVYVVNISSGQVFTASFSERFEHVVIRVENTTTTTGQAIVYVNRGV